MLLPEHSPNIRSRIFEYCYIASLVTALLSVTAASSVFPVLIILLISTAVATITFKFVLSTIGDPIQRAFALLTMSIVTFSYVAKLGGYVLAPWLIDRRLPQAVAHFEQSSRIAELTLLTSLFILITPMSFLLTRALVRFNDTSMATRSKSVLGAYAVVAILIVALAFGYAKSGSIVMGHIGESTGSIGVVVYMKLIVTPILFLVCTELAMRHKVYYLIAPTYILMIVYLAGEAILRGSKGAFIMGSFAILFHLVLRGRRIHRMNPVALGAAVFFSFLFFSIGGYARSMGAGNSALVFSAILSNPVEFVSAIDFSDVAAGMLSRFVGAESFAMVVAGFNRPLGLDSLTLLFDERLYQYFNYEFYGITKVNHGTAPSLPGFAYAIGGLTWGLILYILIVSAFGVIVRFVSFSGLYFPRPYAAVFFASIIAEFTDGDIGRFFAKRLLVYISAIILIETTYRIFGNRQLARSVTESK